MKRNTLKTLLCLVLAVLFAAAALTLTGCQKAETEASSAPAESAAAPSGTEAPKTEVPTEAPKTEAPETEAPAAESEPQAPETEAPQTEAPVTEAPATEPETEAPETEEQTTEELENDAPVPEELGEGTKTFFFEVTHADGRYALFEIHTDAETVGEALTGVDLIDGEESQYGLYVKIVDGEYLDWDTDMMYWAFYENGEYAMTGVDGTTIDESVTYSFVATAG